MFSNDLTNRISESHETYTVEFMESLTKQLMISQPKCVDIELTGIVYVSISIRNEEIDNKTDTDDKAKDIIKRDCSRKIKMS